MTNPDAKTTPACCGGTAGCPGVAVYAPGGGVQCNVCRMRFRPDGRVVTKDE